MRMSDWNSDVCPSSLMLTVALIAFAMFRDVGDPIVSMVGQDTTESQRAELRERLGLNDPFVVQYARFVRDAAQGNFGISYRQRQPVSDLIEQRLPATLELSFISALMALAFGIPIGIYTALRPPGALSRAFMATSLAGARNTVATG